MYLCIHIPLYIHTYVKSVFHSLCSFFLKSSLATSLTKEIRGPNRWIILQTLPLLHVTDWKACIIQIHWARILFLSAIFTLRFQ